MVTLPIEKQSLCGIQPMTAIKPTPLRSLFSKSINKQEAVSFSIFLKHFDVIYQCQIVSWVVSQRLRVYLEASWRFKIFIERKFSFTWLRNLFKLRLDYSCLKHKAQIFNPNFFVAECQSHAQRICVRLSVGETTILRATDSATTPNQLWSRTPT